MEDLTQAVSLAVRQGRRIMAHCTAWEKILKSVSNLNYSRVRNKCSSLKKHTPWKCLKNK